MGERALWNAASRMATMPKSANLGISRPLASRPSRILSGLMSRWTIPGELRVHQLECADFVQSHVGGFKNRTHPPAPDFGDDEVLVVGDHLPWLPLLGLHQPRAVGGASGVFVRVFTEANWA